MARGKAAEIAQTPHPPEKAPSSRRQDAASQHRARKRDLDRLAQRASRERAKSRMLYLEETLARLQADDKQKQISDLMGVIAELRDQNTQLRTMLEKIGRLACSTAEGSSGLDKKLDELSKGTGTMSNVPRMADTPMPMSPPLEDMMMLDPALTDCDSTLPTSSMIVPPISPPKDDSRHSDADVNTNISSGSDLQFPGLANEWWEEDSITVSTGTSTSQTSLSLTCSTPSFGMDNDIDPTTASFNDAFFLGLPDLDPGAIFWPPTTSTMPTFASSPPSKFSVPSPLNQNPNPNPQRRGSRVASDEEKWNVSDRAFTYGIELSRDPSLAISQSPDGTPSCIESHEPFAAVLYGYKSLTESRKFRHPIWIALKEVDERVFGNWKSKPQKIAMMFVTHRLMMYRTNPNPTTLRGVPSFFRPRPSQERIQHPAVIDFLIWPGLRDRLVFNHETYTRSGDFSAAFCANLRFHWPFPEADIFTYDPVTETHRISPLFEKFACDIKNWTMAEEFFHQFSEMSNDIPVQGKSERAEKMFYDGCSTAV